MLVTDKLRLTGPVNKNGLRSANSILKNWHLGKKLAKRLKLNTMNL